MVAFLVGVAASAVAFRGKGGGQRAEQAAHAVGARGPVGKAPASASKRRDVAKLSLRLGSNGEAVRRGGCAPPRAVVGERRPRGLLTGGPVAFTVRTMIVLG